jgi:hypothetical protein
MLPAYVTARPSQAPYTKAAITTMITRTIITIGNNNNNNNRNNRNTRTRHHRPHAHGAFNQAKHQHRTAEGVHTCMDADMKD